MFKKTLNLANVQMKFNSETGAFAGYASVFGGVDSYGDTILRGAYADTLSTQGAPKMFFNHQSWDMPIGKWTQAVEDDHGLYVEGELTVGNRVADDVLAALRHGTLDGLSIGYYLKSGDYEDTDAGRIIRKVTNLVEISVVTWPADSAARVDLASVKNDELLLERVGELDTVRDFERFLRDAGGLSKGLAMALVSRARAIFVEGDPGKSAQAKAIEEAVARLAALRLG